MGTKLHRSRRSVFRKRRPFLKAMLCTIACVAIIACGYFTASLLENSGDTVTETGTTPSSPPVENPSAKPSTPTEGTPPAGGDASVVQGNIKGFYLPFSALSADTLTELSLLPEAKAAGYNAVIFDLKDAEGQLYYAFSHPTAKKVNSYTENALTKEQLTALMDLFQENGLTPIPRLHTFRDNLGAKALMEARISYKENPTWSWYDGADTATAKRWLNPYDNDAHDYIGALATELKELGAGAILLDSVQFPHPSLTGQAGFGTDNATLKWDEVLTLFVGKMKTLLGENCPVILSCTGESALGTATQVYGGNPLTFAPTIAAPLLSPDKAQAAVEQMILRTKVLEEEAKPLLAPWLDISALSAGEVKQALSDCIAGGTNSVFLYHPDGAYDFAAYQ